MTTAAKAAAFAAARSPRELQALMGTSYPDDSYTWAGATGLAQAMIDDLLRQIADLEKRVRLAELRNRLLEAGVTAGSPAELDAEGERLAREERWT